MKPEQREHLLSLCHRVEHEEDPETFTQLICELEVLLDVFYPREEPHLPVC